MVVRKHKMSQGKEARTLPERVRTTKKSPDRRIPVDVSFRIIKQFSTQLYDSPRRAIEELACNSYDAAAESCYINTPEEEGDVLKVLDDGESMDLEGLKWLWKIAESRKEAELDDDRAQFGRKQIGKFGVGKLAAFALGNRLTHVATKNGITRVITVRQDKLRRQEADLLDEDEKPDIPRFGVYEYDVEEAKEILGDFFEDIPDPWERGWSSWTLAVVGDIPEENTGKGLKPQYLHNMIRTSIPISSKFTAFLNGERITERKPNAERRFELGVTDSSITSRVEDKVKEALVDYGEYSSAEEVPEEEYEVSLAEVKNPQDTSETIQGIEVPNLGKVAGTAKFYDSRITSDKRADRGFTDHGFRVHVRGKLLNKDHEKFGLTNLSHRYWIKSLIEVEMPGLDDSIRVQRDDTMDTLEVHIAQAVLRSIFNAVRSKGKKYEDIDEDDPTGGIEKPFSERLSVRSRDYAYQAISGLTEDEDMPANLEEVEIDFAPLGMSRDAVDYDSETARIRINEQHPLIESLERRDGFSDDFRDCLSEILAGRLLLRGYQNYHDVDEYVVRVCGQIFEAVLRSASDNISDEISYEMDHLEDASYQGHTEFEVAIAETLESMGINAVQKGGPDASDGIITIPQAGENLHISVEAKGSGDVVTHKDFGKGDIDRHMEEDDCDYALIVAREFQLEGRPDKDKSAFMRSLKEYESVMDLDSLERLLRLQKARRFSYPQLKKIFTHDEHPDDLPEFINEIWQEKPEEAKTRRILEEAHDYMADNSTYPNIGILDDRLEGIDYDEIWDKLEQVKALTSGKVKFEGDRGSRFQLLADPDAILEDLSDPAITDPSQVEGVGGS